MALRVDEKPPSSVWEVQVAAARLACTLHLVPKMRWWVLHMGVSV